MLVDSGTGQVRLEWKLWRHRFAYSLLSGPGEDGRHQRQETLADSVISEAVAAQGRLSLSRF